MSLELSKYLRILKRRADKFERTDINGTVDESWSAKYLVKGLIFITSGLFVWLLKNGFSDGFVSFGASILSILIGLFITALVFSFDKFYLPVDSEKSNSKTKIWDIQAFNYTKKFSYITGYTIVISIFTLALLAISSLFKDETSLNIFMLELNAKQLDYGSIKLFFFASFLLAQRFFILYWLFKIMYNTLFIVSSMVQFMATKIDR